MTGGLKEKKRKLFGFLFFNFALCCFYFCTFTSTSIVVSLAAEFWLVYLTRIAPYFPAAVLNPITLLPADVVTAVTLDEVPEVILFLIRVLMAPEERRPVTKFTEEGIFFSSVAFLVQLAKS